MLKALALSVWLIVHPVHVSLTSIDHVRGTDSLKVFVRMYYDDFLLDYRMVDPGNSIVKNLSVDQLLPAELMNNYLDEKVRIIVNNKELKGKLLNLELTDNEISVNLLYRTIRNPRVITIRNTIMTGLYDDQANMTILRIKDFEEGVKLTPVKTEQTFDLRLSDNRQIMR